LSRAITSEKAPSAKPAGQSTSRSGMYESSHARGPRCSVPALAHDEG
jgi:hypothetical protein